MHTKIIKILWRSVEGIFALIICTIRVNIDSFWCKSWILVCSCGYMLHICNSILSFSWFSLFWDWLLHFCILIIALMIACLVVRHRNSCKTILDEQYDKKVIGLYLICMHPDNANKSYHRFEVPTRWNSSCVGLQFLVFRVVLFNLAFSRWSQLPSISDIVSNISSVNSFCTKLPLTGILFLCEFTPSMSFSHFWR